MKNIAVLVSGGGTNLQALIDAQKQGELTGGKIAVVLSSSPDAYALSRAEEAGIPTVVVDRSAYENNTEMTRALLKELDKFDIDLVILAGFMTILSEEFVDAYPNAIINIHPALIPSFCGEGYYGLKVHEEALDYGVKLSGATVHFVNKDCDGGPIIMQKAVEVFPDDTPESLQKRIMQQCEWKLLPKAASLFCQDKIHLDGRKVIIDE